MNSNNEYVYVCHGSCQPLNVRIMLPSPKPLPQSLSFSPTLIAQLAVVSKTNLQGEPLLCIKECNHTSPRLLWVFLPAKSFVLFFTFFCTRQLLDFGQV